MLHPINIISGSNKTICYFNLPAWGHIYPTLDLLKKLTKTHTVFYFSTPPFRKCIEDAGANFVDLYSYWHADLNTDYLQPQAILFKASYYIMETMGYSLEISYYLISQLKRLHNKWSPDYILHDNCCLWGKLIAKQWQVPSICTFSTFVMQAGYLRYIPLHWFLDEWKGYRGACRFFKYYNRFSFHYPSLSISIKDMVMNKEKVNLVFLPKELQIHPTNLDSSFYFFPRSFQSRKSTNTFRHYPSSSFLYVSVGTIHTHHLYVLQSIVSILSSLHIPCIVSAGEKYQSILHSKNKLIQVYSSVPQIEILQHCNCKGFITHGGMNSIVEALTYHVPLLIIPQTIEQLITGIQVQKLKKGVVLRKKYPSCQDLRRFIHEFNPLSQEVHGSSRNY
jgi:MGT family glycosyltransferase